LFSVAVALAGWAASRTAGSTAPLPFLSHGQVVIVDGTSYRLTFSKLS
jgi:hypothetical protein